MTTTIALMGLLASEIAAERTDGLAPPPTHAPEPAVEPDLLGGFVLTLHFGLQFCPLFPMPSGELSLFLGGVLPAPPRRPGHWVALGYRGTLGLGGADFGTTAGRFFLFAHRHHLAVHGVAGRRARLAYGAGLGLAAFADESYTDEGRGKAIPFAIEGEGRIGYVMGVRSPVARGVVGLQLRLSEVVYPEASFPFPSIGAFLGVVFG